MKNILGIGNTLVDILIKLTDDKIIEDLKMEKGSMTLVDKVLANDILKLSDLLLKEKSSGGSAANTINGLACMGISTGFIGKVGEDEYGQFFRNDMRKYNVNPYLSIGSADTGKCLVLISKDSERTFATYLGASVELGAADLSETLFKKYDYIYLEGYLVINRDLVQKVIDCSKAANCKLVIDLSSYNVVEENREYLLNMIEKHIDIVFANETEAMSLTREKTAGASLDRLADITEIGVVKIGKEGSMVKHKGQKYIIHPTRSEAIDTTGAGDLYASGFLYGLLKNYPLEICGQLGSLVSGKVVEAIGARMDKNTWTEIINSIGIIEQRL